MKGNFKIKDFIWFLSLLIKSILIISNNNCKLLRSCKINGCLKKCISKRSSSYWLWKNDRIVIGVRVLTRAEIPSKHPT